MTGTPARILVLGFGNEILGDDAVGLVAARRLRGHCPAEVDVIEAAESGLGLLDFLEGRSHALLLDAIATGRHEPGTLLEFSREDFDRAMGASPHYAGLADVLGLAGCLDIPVPEDLRVLAMEVANPYHIREGLSLPVEEALPGYVGRAREIVDRWRRSRSLSDASVELDAGRHDRLVLAPVLGEDRPARVDDERVPPGDFEEAPTGPEGSHGRRHRLR